MKSIFMLGTDTNVGKTHAAAALMLKYADLYYWKAVQTGFPPDDDCETVRKLTKFDSERFLETGFSYREPLSPHHASELENKELGIDCIISTYRKISSGKTLLLEGAGGLLVPINRKETWLDFLVREDFQIVIAARTGLGTINHTLLTIRCLAEKNIRPAGLIFCGEENHDNIKTILEFSGAPFLGRFYYDGKSDFSRLDLSGIDPEGLLL